MSKLGVVENLERIVKKQPAYGHLRSNRQETGCLNED